MEKAAKAIDKDDKKKMGEEKFSTLLKVRKQLQQRNHGSKDLARRLEEIMDDPGMGGSHQHGSHHHGGHSQGPPPPPPPPMMPMPPPPGRPYRDRKAEG